jgi:hypothetical protein
MHPPGLQNENIGNFIRRNRSHNACLENLIFLFDRIRRQNYAIRNSCT